jgi:Na+/H+-dicarboxylate symporter
MLARMKIWMKYLLGSALGVALALALPESDAAIGGLLSYLFELALRVGRYALVPLLFFSLPVAVYELNEDKEFWRILGKSILMILVAVLAFALAGVIIAAVARPARIPLLSDALPPGAPPTLRSLLLGVFPPSMFESLLAGNFLLPVSFLAILLGLSFSHDRVATKPALSLFDSFSRIVYQINSFFVEFLGVLVIATAAWSTVALRSALREDVYRPLLILLLAEVLVVGFLAIPGLIYLLGGVKNPWRALYGLLAPALAGLFSGDVFFPAGSLLKHGKESLGVRRRVSSLVLPLALIMGRAGSVLIASTAFVVVLSSYSNLGISLGSLAWIVLASPFLALVLGAEPGRGAMAGLITLCGLYGKGFENGYLIAAPLALPLAAAGVVLDLIWAGALSLIVAKRAGDVSEKEARFFI